MHGELTHSFGTPKNRWNTTALISWMVELSARTRRMFIRTFAKGWNDGKDAKNGGTNDGIQDYWNFLPRPAGTGARAVGKSRCLKSVCKLSREGRMHLGGSQSRSSARAFISLPTTGNTSPRRAWRRSAAIARISSVLVSRSRHRQTTAGKRRCEATPYSLPNTPVPAVVVAAWRSGGKFLRELPSRPSASRASSIS